MYCIFFKVLNSDGFILAMGYTGQIGIRNWQDIGFGLSPILSNETCEDVCNRLLSLYGPIRDFFPQKVLPSAEIPVCF